MFRVICKAQGGIRSNMLNASFFFLGGIAWRFIAIRFYLTCSISQQYEHTISSLTNTIHKTTPDKRNFNHSDTPRAHD